MLFRSIISLALAALAAANSVHFVNQDGTQRTIYFTAQEGLAVLQPLTIGGWRAADQAFPDGWIGNWYSVSEGAPNVPGMLGEVRFNGYAGDTYFDVSAIVNPSDTNGVKQIFPANSAEPVSGCANFPCNSAYVHSDDVQTQATDDSNLICLLGTAPATRRRGAVARSFIES